MAKRKPTKPQKQSTHAPKPSVSKVKSDQAHAGVVDNKKPLRWLIWGGVAITLVMWLAINDPFNAPKSWFLSITGFWLLGWLAFNWKQYIQVSALKQATILAGAFALTLIISWFATDNKYVGFFGQYGRKTGLLEYICLITFLLAASYLIRLDRVSKLERSIVFLGTVLGIYGFFQHYKIDFIKWNYLYNSVLGTLGNPDFAGAIMAILLVLNFGVAIRKAHQTWFRVVAGFNVLLLAIVIVFSQARQGLLAAGLGVGFIVLVWIYQKNKRAAQGLAALSILGGISVIAGMLKIGPLTRLFYKDSVTYRGDYWRAAMRMFIHHPLFGVGLDRYGAYFRQYRDATQTLRRGPSVLADAAHDVPLQLAATGGILVLVALLALTGLSLWRGIVALRNTTGTNQILVAIIFGAWITYEAQSLISLDNLGIAIWGYILGGALIGISVLPQTQAEAVIKQSQAQPLVSGILAAIFVVISFLFFQSESAYHSLAAIVPPTDKTLQKEYEGFVNKPVSYGFKEPSFLLTAGQDYSKVGDNAKAITTLTSLIKSDPRYVDAITALSGIYMSEKNYSAAIALDNKAVALDPFNQTLLLQLGEDLKKSGDIAGAKSVIARINAFAPNSSEAKQAQQDFGQ